MNKGDFIKIEFVGRVAATGEIFDLTSKEIAKKEGIYNEKQKYQPALVVMGANMVVPGVEKRLEGMQPGGEKEFTLHPDEAFGKRDIKLIKIVSKSVFIKQKINPVPGIFVTINGKQAKIQNVTGGRIRIDFNHPLAGKELTYRVKILEQITGTLEKAKEMIKYYGINAETKIVQEKLQIHTVKPLPDVVEKIIDEKMKEWIKEIKHISFFSKEGKKEGKPGESKENPVEKTAEPQGSAETTKPEPEAPADAETPTETSS